MSSVKVKWILYLQQRIKDLPHKVFLYLNNLVKNNFLSLHAVAL